MEIQIKEIKQKKDSLNCAVLDVVAKAKELDLLVEEIISKKVGSQ